MESHVIVKATIDDIKSIRLSASITEPGGRYAPPRKNGCITSGQENDMVPTKISVNIALMARIADDKPYNITIEFLFDLNHKKNRCASSPSIVIATI